MGAKASTDITYWPKAISLGAKIVTNARVRELIVGKDGLVKGALYYDENGNLQQQNAKLVVVACNGVGTPRLLLNSSSSMFPDGLANSSGLVGKNLMFHPYAAVTGSDGSFSIPNLPSGTYQVEVWHELLGSQTHEVTVEEGKIATLDLALQPPS